MPVHELDIDGIWAQIEAVPGPGPDPRLPSDAVAAGGGLLLPLAMRAYPLRTILIPIAAGSAYGIWQMGGIWAAVLGFALLFVFLVLWRVGGREPNYLPRKQRPDRLQEAREDYARREQQYRDNDSEAAFRTEVEKLRDLRDKLVALRDAPLERHPRVLRARGTAQRRRYLAGFALADADIAELGEDARAALARRGIETADQVHMSRVTETDGLDEAAIEAVRQWRDALNKSFRFDPNAPDDPADRQAIEEDFRDWQRDSVRTYSAGPRVLQHKRATIIRDRPWRIRHLRQDWARLQLLELTRASGSRDAAK